jgi:hypothetical protein
VGADIINALLMIPPICPTSVAQTHAKVVRRRVLPRFSCDECLTED